MIIAIMAGQMVSIQGQVVLRDKHHNTFRKGITAADQGDYTTAIDYFQQIISETPDHIDALTQLGVTYMESNQQLDSAITLFDRVLSLIPPEDIYDPFGIYLHQVKARTYNLMLQPRKALAVLNNIKDSVQLEDIKEEVDLELQQTANAIILLDNPIKLKITDVGPAVNSEFDDHSPLVNITGQEMYFTSRRPLGKDRKLPDNQYFENIFQSKNQGDGWQTPVAVDELIKRNEHLSILSLSADGNLLFLYKDEGRITRNLFVSQRVNGEWQDPEKLPAPINSEFDETHASLSPDMSTLYFTSNRPGGYGGLDIYEIEKDKYGQWGEPHNLGPAINTPYDEETPMMHPDGKTLYFNSDGPFSMGGFDVLYSQKMADGHWAAAVNMGYPVNSPDDDLFFLPTLDKSEAYLTTFRYSDSHGHSSIYHVTFEEAPGGALTVIEGAMENPDNLPLEHLRILVWRESDNHKVGEFRANPHTGRYLLVLDAEESYRIQEATPEVVRDIDTLHISREVALNHKNKILMVEDVKMFSPLIPRQFEEPETLLAAVEEPLEAQPSPDNHRATHTEEKRTAFDARIPASTTRDTTPTQPATQTSTSLAKPYTIQILALKKRQQANKQYLAGLDTTDIKTYKGKDGYLRYVIGYFDDPSAAESYLKSLKSNDRFQDAWIRELSRLEKISY
ncbi:tetratricopeptide repeat protein [Geofilum rubicundum]|nr:tetratricopeptide repeat protein [Geofilum rubicundum]